MGRVMALAPNTAQGNNRYQKFNYICAFIYNPK